jgi:hypothetical protein
MKLLLKQNTSDEETCRNRLENAYGTHKKPKKRADQGKKAVTIGASAQYKKKKKA